MRVIKTALAAFLALGAMATPALSEDLEIIGKLEAGGEFDSNVFRLEVPEDSDVEVQASPLIRLGSRLRADWRSGANVVRGRAFAGLKSFTDSMADPENVAVLSGSGSYTHVFAKRRLGLGVAGSFYDAVDPDGGPSSGRNFRTGQGVVNATLIGSGNHRVQASVGYRGFEYKPDEDFNWHGESYGLQYRNTWWKGEEEAQEASVDVSLRYGLERRRFAGLAFSGACPEVNGVVAPCPTRISRVDLAHTGTAELSYTGDRLYALRYQLQVNDSNSFGQSLFRNRIELEMTSEVFLDIFATVKATLQLNTFLDGLLLSRDVNNQTFISIEDENRSGISAVLSREISPSLAVQGRYAFFTNELSEAELSFRRQLVYLGAVYSFGGDS